MPEPFSIPREFDYVQLRGLRRATGRPPHEWDIYIIKELIDNGLDADDAIWQNDQSNFPCIKINLEYTRVQDSQIPQLYVQVQNRAEFPVEAIQDIFEVHRYTTRKAFIKEINRGALGNALKTVLGIPYALHNRAADDWVPDLTPLSIACNELEYLPRYLVNSTEQNLNFELKSRSIGRIEGTLISVGLDYFEQEVPRNLKQIQHLAEEYRVCNPHAEFHWSVEIANERWEKVFEPDQTWSNKFRGTPPIHWYSQAAFQEYLGALLRKDNSNKEYLALERIYEAFASYHDELDFSSAPFSIQVSRAFGKESLSRAEIEDATSLQLYRLMREYSPNISSTMLGALGGDHLQREFSQFLSVDGSIFYGSIQDNGSDPITPFIVESAIAFLKEGKRQIWTAINFSPTYEDPFFNRSLPVQANPDAQIRGLHGFLDAQGIREDTGFLLFLHLICPNIEHDEFSKTAINHLPFKQAISDLLDRQIKALRQGREDEEQRVRALITHALDQIIAELGLRERFVFEQLVEKLQARLSQHPDLSSWLSNPDSGTRLRSYISEYESQRNFVTQHVARPPGSTLFIPVHPNHHFSIPVERLSPEILKQHYVNKILYSAVRDIEAVILENDWLSMMDLALLHVPTGGENLRESLIQCSLSCDLPVLVIHDADTPGEAIAKQFAKWLSEQQIDPNRVIDLGLANSGSETNRGEYIRLLQFMPNELADWLLGRFADFDLPLKFAPSDDELRHEIRRSFDNLLEAHLWEGASEEFGLTRLMTLLDYTLNVASALQTRALDNSLKLELLGEQRQQSYHYLLEEMTKVFYQQFMQQYGSQIEALTLAHFLELKKGDKP